jgi:ABC-type Fe3+/spermidine/putrescine transport system ATPase subunit
LGGFEKRGEERREEKKESQKSLKVYRKIDTHAKSEAISLESRIFVLEETSNVQ